MSKRPQRGAGTNPGDCRPPSLLDHAPYLSPLPLECLALWLLRLLVLSFPPSPGPSCPPNPTPSPRPCLPAKLALCAPLAPHPGCFCPPVGRAGGGVFSLVRHPCQKHLVYKLAAASRLPLQSSGRWADRAEAPGRLPPAPGPRSPCAPLATRPQPSRRAGPQPSQLLSGPGQRTTGTGRDLLGASTWVYPQRQVRG